jgi:hypothetical protein
VAIEWLEPWYQLGSEDAERVRAFEYELSRELGPGHVLARVPIEAFGKRDDCDDVLFRLKDGSGRFAVVHLTWTGKQDQPPWPATELFDSEADWIERGLRPDHQEYVSG